MLMYCMYTCTDGVPSDGVPMEEVVTVSLFLTVVYVILATFGIVFAVVCLMFTFIFREKRRVILILTTCMIVQIEIINFLTVV